MPHLGVLDARLLVMGSPQAAFYGTEAMAYAGVSTHQLGSPLAYQVPSAWLAPPRSTGGCRRPDLRHAFHDLVDSAPKNAVISVRCSPLSKSKEALSLKTPPISLEIQPGRKTRDFENFLEVVQRVRALHEDMGVMAILLGGGLADNTIFFSAETQHPLGENPLRIQLRMNRRPSRYWGESLTVHVAADRQKGKVQVVSGHPRLVDSLSGRFSSLVGLVQYFDACVASAEVRGQLSVGPAASEDEPQLTGLRLVPRPPKRSPAFPIEESHFFSRLSMGQAEFIGPMLVWSGKARTTLRAMDRELSASGYVLLAQTHDQGILEQTPNCRYRLSAGLEKIGSPALRLAQKMVDEGKTYVMAHGLETFEKGKIARILSLPHSETVASMFFASVQLFANGREAGVRLFL